MDYERLLLDHLEVINRIVRAVGRRRHLSTAEQADFLSFVRERLLENDYAVLRKFQRRSALATYLSAVVNKMSLDFLIERWGRWRPSAVATKLGTVAVLLERLVLRDDHTLEEAMEIARTNHAVGLSYSELRAIWQELPVRTRTAEVGEEAAAHVASHDSADRRVEDAERQRRLERLDQVLRAAFEQIPVKDRSLIALRYDQDLSMVEIAALTGSSVPTLHRRLDKALQQLSRALEEAGFGRGDVAVLIGHPSMTLSPLLRKEVERFSGPGRLTKRDD